MAGGSASSGAASYGQQAPEASPLICTPSCLGSQTEKRLCEKESPKRVDASVGVEHAEGATSSQPSLVNATCPVTPAAATTAAAAATDNAATSEIKTGRWPAAIVAAEDVANNANIAYTNEVMRLFLCGQFFMCERKRVCSLVVACHVAIAAPLLTDYPPATAPAARMRAPPAPEALASVDTNPPSLARVLTLTQARERAAGGVGIAFSHTCTHTHTHTHTDERALTRHCQEAR